MKKNFWEKVYSFLGIWTYTLHTDDDHAYKVVYWCCFPWKFFRKVELFKIDVSSSKSINVQKEKLRKRFLELGEPVPECLSRYM